MPCVLVSPDSVARFFPAAAGLFDLVVFDEASQIRVADAVGALGRARAAVVVGDSQADAADVVRRADRPVSDDVVDLAETAVEDEESILSECVQARVPRQWLSWHYRSQDESLIAFSNAQYYENRLSSFPAPTHGRASSEPDGRGVSLVRVPGTFHRSGAGRLLRTNPIEAKAIVAEIRRRFDAVPKWDGVDAVPSIGVVTFNAQQRAYIEALLRDADDDRLAAALDRTDGEGLFVKNLENVQGDERDVIFFSTGFSANADGDAAAELRPAEPGRRRAAAQRRDHPRPAPGRRLLLLRPGAAAGRGDVVGRHQAPAGLPRHGRAGHRRAAARRRARSPVVDRHREEIAAALRERGLVVRTDVGLSEFTVDLVGRATVDPETPVMAVLLDGPAWARRGTVGDRDGLPVEVLGEMLRWPVVERVWLPSWLAVRDRRPRPAGRRPSTRCPSAPVARADRRCRRRRSSRSRAWRRCARR